MNRRQVLCTTGLGLVGGQWLMPGDFRPHHAGDCWDNYQVDFVYPENVHLSFSSTQFGDYGGFDAGIRMYGADGSAAIGYSGPIQILGAHARSRQDSAASTTQGKFAATPSSKASLQAPGITRSPQVLQLR